MLRFESVTVRLHDRLQADSIDALSNVTFRVAPGEAIALLGPNGAGKSTLLLAAGGLIPIDAGRITIMGRQVRTGRREARFLRERIGLALQFPERAMFAPTVEQEVSFTSRCLGRGARQAADDCRRTLDGLGIPRSFLNRSPHELSGGERRKVALAAAVAHRPSLLLLDEPDVGLDVRGLEDLSRFIGTFKDAGGSALIVTHHAEWAFTWADRFLVMESGLIATDMSATRTDVEKCWGVVAPWLWDQGAMGRLQSAAHQAGIPLASPYASPASFAEDVKRLLRNEA